MPEARVPRRVCGWFFNTLSSRAEAGAWCYSSSRKASVQDSKSQLLSLLTSERSSSQELLLYRKGWYHWFGKGWSGQAAVYHSSLVFPALLLIFQEQVGTYAVFTIYRLTVTSEQQRDKTFRNKVKPLTQFLAVLTWATAGLRDININGAAELELLPSRQNLVFWSALFALWQPMNILSLVYYYYSQFSLLL